MGVKEGDLILTGCNACNERLLFLWRDVMDVDWAESVSGNSAADCVHCNENAQTSQK